MTRRTTSCGMVSFDISHEERQALDHLKQLADVNSDANLARVALWSLADELGVDLPNGVFDRRHSTGRWPLKVRA